MRRRQGIQTVLPMHPRKQREVVQEAPRRGRVRRRPRAAGDDRLREVLVDGSSEW